MCNVLSLKGSVMYHYSKQKSWLISFGSIWKINICKEVGNFELSNDANVEIWLNIGAEVGVGLQVQTMD